MKKLMMLSFLLALYVSGCVFVYEEDTEEFKELSARYEDYVIQDIGDFDQFQYFINQATYESSLSIILIEVQFFNALDNLVETRYGSGVIIDTIASYYYVLTSIELIDVPQDYEVRYKLSDNQGRVATGYYDMSSEDHQLLVIRFLKSRQYTLPSLAIGDIEPFVGEPVLLMGYQQQILNAMSMGLIESYVHQEEAWMTIQTNIPSDTYGNGGAIINIDHEIVGIQIGVSEQNAVAVALSTIQDFIELFNSKHSIS